MAVQNAVDPHDTTASFTALVSPSDPGAIDAVELFRTLRSRRSTVATVTLVCAVLATILAFVLPKKYTSTASFIPPNLNAGSPLAAALAGQLSGAGGTDLLSGGKTPAELYAGILRSRSIAAELVNKFNL